MAWTVSWQVLIDGQDMTAVMTPFLQDITVTDKDGAVSDTCQLTFDDTGAQIRLPSTGSLVAVFLQGIAVFLGKVDSVRSRGSRGGGRELTVGAKGFDATGKPKEPQSFHMDDSALPDFLGRAAKNAGLAGVKVGGALAGIRRAYWAADGESFVHLGQRLAREFYATFKIRGDTAVFMPRGEDFGLSGVAGIVGDNVITWDIAPVTGRPVFAKGTVTWFDRKTATYKDKSVTFEASPGVSTDATNRTRSAAADEDQADAVGDGRKRQSKREAGEGSVELDLEPYAQAESLFTLAGARPGVDGVYRIVSVTHKASRSSGSTTSLELKQPDGGAGEDGR
jgi:phage protein D